MEDGIIAFTQLIGRGATLLAQLYPHVGRDIRRDIKRTAVANHKGRFGTCLSQTHETVFECQLSLQDGQLSLIVEFGVGRQVAPATLTIHSRNFRNGKHLESQI